VGVANFFGSIDRYITFQLKFFFWHENCGRHRFVRFVCVKVGVANFFFRLIDRY